MDRAEQVARNAPRPYDLDNPAEVRRLLRETLGYLKTSQHYNQGTDFIGRQHAIDALERYALRASQPQWRTDMENAPRDGTWFIAWPGETEDGRAAVRCKWYAHPSIAGWLTDAYDCGDYEFEPTHWMPLPPPPVQETEGG